MPLLTSERFPPESDAFECLSWRSTAQEAPNKLPQLCPLTGHYEVYSCGTSKPQYRLHQNTMKLYLIEILNANRNVHFYISISTKAIFRL